ncbi:MAG: PRC-barrel domain protein [Methanosaeta sp. PtaB.Bin039]|nr:MAG: PRC-barrel domain protein [Methanosaeta sp. PtaB.Bin039]HOT07506.1 PRC-barrel domain-containing protein [Methanotrichaceae archaeon]HQF16104.1 PRC-barrel domain-containing protein [Methanotrichaceae archaeon]HQI90782.1 PRC-barrel domain-containing protein [Methanotrichaceae archaeon]HQJ28262.1 PRC-barrel domain-containing protein [Methanotrichaceae archaeon]
MRAEITSLMGLEVYTEKGVYVGRVEDALLDPEKKSVSGLALVKVNREFFDGRGRGIIIPFRWVLAVGDIVLMKHLKMRPSAQTRS